MRPSGGMRRIRCGSGMWNGVRCGRRCAGRHVTGTRGDGTVFREMRAVRDWRPGGQMRRRGRMDWPIIAAQRGDHDAPSHPVQPHQADCHRGGSRHDQDAQGGPGGQSRQRCGHVGISARNRGLGECADKRETHSRQRPLPPRGTPPYGTQIAVFVPAQTRTAGRDVAAAHGSRLADRLSADQRFDGWDGVNLGHERIVGIPQAKDCDK